MTPYAVVAHDITPGQVEVLKAAILFMEAIPDRVEKPDILNNGDFWSCHACCMVFKEIGAFGYPAIPTNALSDWNIEHGHFGGMQSHSWLWNTQGGDNAVILDLYPCGGAVPQIVVDRGSLPWRKLYQPQVRPNHSFKGRVRLWEQEAEQLHEALVGSERWLRLLAAA